MPLPILAVLFFIEWSPGYKKYWISLGSRVLQKFTLSVLSVYGCFSKGTHYLTT